MVVYINNKKLNTNDSKYKMLKNAKDFTSLLKAIRYMIKDKNAIITEADIKKGIFVNGKTKDTFEFFSITSLTCPISLIKSSMV